MSEAWWIYTSCNAKVVMFISLYTTYQMLCPNQCSGGKCASYPAGNRRCLDDTLVVVHMLALHRQSCTALILFLEPYQTINLRLFQKIYLTLFLNFMGNQREMPIHPQMLIRTEILQTEQ